MMAKVRLLLNSSCKLSLGAVQTLNSPRSLDSLVDYLVNEYWPQDETETLHDCFANSGSSPEVMQKIVEPNLPRLVNRTHPYCDDFIYSCACDVIRHFKPNLLMIHPANVDAYRHWTGVFSDRVTHGLGANA